MRDARVRAAIDRRLVRHELPVGLRVGLLPDDQPDVRVLLNLRLGEEKSLRGRRVIGEMTGSLIERFSRRGQQRAEASEHVRWGRSGPFSWGATASFQVPARELTKTLKIVTQALRDPSFERSMLEEVRAERLERIAAGATDPIGLATTAFSKHLAPWPPDDVRYYQDPREMQEAVERVTLEDVQRFHHDLFGASSGELVVLHGPESREVISVVEEVMGDWTSRVPYSRLVGGWSAIPPFQATLALPGSALGFSLAGQRIRLREGDADFPALELANFMLGGGSKLPGVTPRSRLRDALTEMGLAYSTGSIFHASTQDPDAYFWCYALYDPRRGRDVRETLLATIHQVLDSGFEPEEFASAREQWRNARETSWEHDEILQEQVSSHLHERASLASADLDERVAQLTVQEVAGAFQRHIDPARFSVVHAGDQQQESASC